MFSGIAQLPAGALLRLCCSFPISQHPWDARRSLLGLQEGEDPSFPGRSKLQRAFHRGDRSQEED